MNSPSAAPIWSFLFAKSPLIFTIHYLITSKISHNIITLLLSIFLYGIKTCLLFFEQQLLNAKKNFAFSSRPSALSLLGPRSSLLWPRGLALRTADGSAKDGWSDGWTLSNRASSLLARMGLVCGQDDLFWIMHPTTYVPRWVRYPKEINGSVCGQDHVCMLLQKLIIFQFQEKEWIEFDKSLPEVLWITLRPLVF